MAKQIISFNKIGFNPSKEPTAVLTGLAFLAALLMVILCFNPSKEPTAVLTPDQPMTELDE